MPNQYARLMTHKTSRLLLSSCLFVGALVLAGCSRSSGSTAATSTTSSVPTTTLQLSTPLTSASKILHAVGTATTYGWNQLIGTSTNSGQSVGVEMLGNVAYVSGVGPFFGFVTYTWPDGSTLGVQMNGSAKAGANGTTLFSSPLTVLGGTGRYATAKGTGTFTGSRSGVVGSPVEATFSLHLSGGTN